MSEKEEKLKSLAIICDKNELYQNKLDAYEFLCEEGEEIIDEMMERVYTLEGDDAQMLVEILSNFKGRKDIYLLLVTSLYRGDDIALSAKLLGSYEDERAIEILNDFASENEINYNEYMEIRNAVEQLGGIFALKKDFSDDPFYKFIKGIDDEEAVKEDIAYEKAEIEEEAEEAAEEKCEEKEAYETDIIFGCGCHKNDCDCDENDDECDDECGCHDIDCDCAEDFDK